MTPDGDASVPVDRHVQCTAADWHATLAGLKDEGYTFFDWLSAVDQVDAPEPGLDVVAYLFAPGTRPLRGVLVRARVPIDEPLDSVTTLWRGAAWHERETHEMFGLDFRGFADGSRWGMRPLLLPEGFEGNPLRKEFVLAARAAKAWPGAKDPGESGDSRRSPSRRKTLPPGVPDPSWGPR